MIPLSGNTYPVRRKLAALGAVYDPRKGRWLVHPSRYQSALEIIARGGAQCHR